MWEKIKEWVIEHTIKTIIGGVILAIVGLVNWTEFGKEYYGKIIFFLSSTTAINNTLLILLGLSTSIFLLFLIIRVLRFLRSSTPDFVNYTQDKFDGIHWGWRWSKDLLGYYNIELFQPACPKCGYTLYERPNSDFIHVDDTNKLYCYNCDFTRQLPTFHNITYSKHIKNKIQQNVNTGAYKTKI